jgi:hypothetical protein
LGAAFLIDGIEIGLVITNRIGHIGYGYRK